MCANQLLDFHCARNPDKGPAGYPIPSTDPALRQHANCCGMPDKEAIVCELKVPMTNVGWVPLPNSPAGSYEITVFGLNQFNCVLEKNKKYWIAPSPVMDFTNGPIVNGFIFLWTSQNIADHEAQVISEGIFVDQWSGLQSQLMWFQPDLYLAIWATKATPPVDEVCHYDNLRLSDAGIPILHAQKSGGGPANPPYYSEVADDFILSDPDDPDGDNGCLLEQVQFAVTHDTPGISPQNWNGVKITIYQDRGNVCGAAMDFPCLRNPAKGPAGYPIANFDATDRQHAACCPNPTKEAIVCELKVPMSKVTWNAIPGPAPDSYDITVFGLEQFNCVLEKNKKYWIAPVPEMEFVNPIDGAPFQARVD